MEISLTVEGRLPIGGIDGTEICHWTVGIPLIILFECSISQRHNLKEYLPAVSFPQPQLRGQQLVPFCGSSRAIRQYCTFVNDTLCTLTTKM